MDTSLSTDFLQLIKTRRSIRGPLLDATVAISDDEITMLMDAARFAPSGSNAQSWYFILIENKSIIEQFVTLTKEKVEEISKAIEGQSHAAEISLYLKNFYSFAGAPYLMVFCIRKRDNPLMRYLRVGDKFKDELLALSNTEIISISMAMENFALMAHALNIGTCVMTGPLLVREQMEKILELHASYSIVALSTVGKIRKVGEVAEIDKNYEMNVPRRKDIDKILKRVK
ncbi:MAG: nitroreductase family protein [Oligoflexia bacterium]|nr:nitroreductase family protein [Oligoflexia bacterium]